MWDLGGMGHRDPMTLHCQPTAGWKFRTEERQKTWVPVSSPVNSQGILGIFLCFSGLPFSHLYNKCSLAKVPWSLLTLLFWSYKWEKKKSAICLRERTVYLWKLVRLEGSRAQRWGPESPFSLVVIFPFTCTFERFWELKRTLVNDRVIRLLKRLCQMFIKLAFH